MAQMCPSCRAETLRLIDQSEPAECECPDQDPWTTPTHYHPDCPWNPEVDKPTEIKFKVKACPNCDYEVPERITYEDCEMCGEAITYRDGIPQDDEIAEFVDVESGNEPHWTGHASCGFERGFELA